MGGELRDQVAGGVAWTLAEKAGSMVLQVGVSLLVLRFLTPEDLGVMAIPTVISALALILVDSGFSQTLIRKVDPSPADYHSVFCFNIAVSLGLYALLVAVMPAVARFYAMPELVAIAPILFLLLPLNALSVIQATIFTRQFRFALLSKVLFASSLLSGLLAVGMAWAGCGVWSLVGQRVASMGIRALLLWALGTWRPRGEWSPAALHTMAPYSLRLLATDFISTTYNNISQLFIGRLYPVDTLGFFNQAQKLKDLPVTSVVQSVQNVTFPALTRIADDRAKFAESYRQLAMVVAFGMFPAVAGMIAVAHDLFEGLLGAKWMPIVPYFRVIALTGLFSPLAIISYNVLKVCSNGRVIVRLEVVKKLFMTAVLAVTIPRSVEAVIWALVLSAGFDWTVNFIAAARYTDLGVARYFRTLLPPALLSGAMYLAVEWFGCVVTLPVLAMLVCKILIGVTLYVALAALFRLEAMQVGWGVVRKILRRA